MTGALLGGIELGGTKVVCVVGYGPEDVRAVERHPTTTPDETLAWAVTRLQAYQADHGPLVAVGLATFGPVDLRPDAPSYGRLLDTPKRRWAGADVVGPVRSAFPGLPVGVGSDVDGAALAEGAAGAARDLRDYAYVTIGTGVGMGIVVDGALVHGLLHPEMGHVTVPRQPGDTYQGSCFAHRDCLEGMASGTAMAARWGCPPDELEGDRLEAALALEARYLAAGLRNAVYAFAPERIVLGGGVAQMPGLVERVRRELAVSLGGYPGLAEYGRPNFVVAAGLGDRAGPAGALVLATTAARAARVIVSPEEDDKPSR
ncbi:MAG TPA: ROK family protein [Acidimicrobiales bacterium]|nr:ROK family protein [Acidimicrobiales bacterium]